MSSEAKKRKMDPKQRKKIYGKQNSKKTFMEVGQSGFLVTCNFREKDCIRESYSVLNEFADLLFGKQETESKSVPEEAKKASNDSSDDEGGEEIDISKQLEMQIAETAKEFKQKSHRFQVTDNGNITNCIFIKATVPDVVELGVKIVSDILETKKARTKNVLRFMPVEVVCKANISDIVNAAGALFDKYFLKEPRTFAINFNHRLNNQISRDVIIKELAELINSKNIGNKVDLKNAQLTVVVEVLKGFCCLSVLPDFQKYRKYNLQELSAKANAGNDAKLNENEPNSKEKD
ncbi:THUMP domain-containing protein 1 homolog [Culicoides brevitarsis]|uniref:THUMP domain-containing protein 1 homolog n=1 Tax=Culicoides brevitarsis TaxID=469753 RepID=UPI00307BC6AB